MVFVVFRRVEVYASVALVGVAVVDYLLYQLLLLYDMARGVRLNAGRQHVEGGHGVMVAVGVILRNLHRLELFQAGLLLYLVLALVGVVLKVAHVGDVAHVPYLISKVLQVTEKHVKRYRGAGVAQVRVAVNGRAAHVHSNVWSVQRLEAFLPSRKCIVD